MVKVRANSLKLGWRDYLFDGDSQCKMCHKDVETIEHFLVDCSSLQQIRSECIYLQLPAKENPEDIIGKLLLLEDNLYGQDFFINLLSKLWIARKKILE